jgi:hypothetical protein
MKDPGRAEADGRQEGVPVAGQRRVGERLVALLLAGVAALNFPLLFLFGDSGHLAGIPALYVYLFLVWLLLAAGTAFALRKRPPGLDGSGDEVAPPEP